MRGSRATASTPSDLKFDLDFDPRWGEAVALADGIVRLTAPNRSPYTFTGTNTYLLGQDRLLVVDPGPDDAGHLQALLRAIGGRPLEAVLLTHTHRDHSGLARRLAAETGAPLWFGGRHRLSRRRRPFEISLVGRDADRGLLPDRTLVDGERIDLPDLAVEVIATPGHCANHLAFGIAGTPWLLSGDHVMGWNSTLVPVQDGSMGDYLRSLDRLIGGRFDAYLPGHGGAIPGGRAHARALRAHRELRNRQILALLEDGPRSLPQLVGGIYRGLPRSLRVAARMTLEAHLDYLEGRGDIAVRRSLGGRVQARLARPHST